MLFFSVILDMVQRVKMADEGVAVGPVAEQEIVNKDDEENGDNEEEEKGTEEEEEEMYGEIVRSWQILPLDFICGSI